MDGKRYTMETKLKKVGLAVWISGKVNFKIDSITRIKTDISIMIKTDFIRRHNNHKLYVSNKQSLKVHQAKIDRNKHFHSHSCIC